VQPLGENLGLSTKYLLVLENLPLTSLSLPFSISASLLWLELFRQLLLLPREIELPKEIDLECMCVLHLPIDFL